MKSKKDVPGLDKFPGSRKRWWNSKVLEESEPPSFQSWQHDHSLEPRVSEVAISPVALAKIYGDNSLGRHIEKLLEGIHRDTKEP